MSINLEKHLNPRRKRKPVEKEFHVVNREADLLRIRVNKLMQHPVCRHVDASIMQSISCFL